MKILVMALNQYSFADSKTGELKEGATIEYLNEATNTETKKGFFSLKQSIDKEVAKPIDKVPGVYEVFISMKSGVDRKAQVIMDRFEYINDFDIEF